MHRTDKCSELFLLSIAEPSIFQRLQNATLNEEEFVEGRVESVLITDMFGYRAVHACKGRFQSISDLLCRPVAGNFVLFEVAS